MGLGVQVVVLTAVNRPEQKAQGNGDEDQSDGNQKIKTFHNKCRQE